MTSATPIPILGRAALIPVRRKLIPLVFIMVLQGLDEDQVLRLVEDGTLWPAWDLAVSHGKKTVRVWRGAVENYKSGQSSTKAPLQSIIAESLPPLGITPASSANGANGLMRSSIPITPRPSRAAA